MQTLRQLYPPIEPFDTGVLSVSPLHTIYYEEVGNPKGRKAVFLHGGPGGGIEPDYRRYFDPERWHIVLFDQRGCGRSTPHAELRENTTWDLVADIERLRERIGIDRWVVFGGRWGSTLALAYAQTHPERVPGADPARHLPAPAQGAAVVLPGGRERALPGGLGRVPAPIPAVERGDMMGAYYQRLTAPDAAVRREAARAWSVWEGTTSKLRPDPKLVERFGGDTFADAFARIECHYFVNGGLPAHGHAAARRRRRGSRTCPA